MAGEKNSGAKRASSRALQGQGRGSESFVVYAACAR